MIINDTTRIRNRVPFVDGSATWGEKLEGLQSPEAIPTSSSDPLRKGEKVKTVRKFIGRTWEIVENPARGVKRGERADHHKYR